MTLLSLMHGFVCKLYNLTSWHDILSTEKAPCVLFKRRFWKMLKSRSCVFSPRPLDGTVHLCHHCSGRYCFQRPVHFHTSYHGNSDGEHVQYGLEKSVLFFFLPLGWYWHLGPSCLHWAEGVRCGILCVWGGGCWWDSTMTLSPNQGIIFCSVLTPQWLCCFFRD